MKKKKTSKRLVLNKETVRELQGSMQWVAGGSDATFSCKDSWCMSCICPPVTD
jgi:hypothetical protein